MHPKLNHYYRYSYRNTQTGISGNSRKQYVDSRTAIESVFSGLKNLESNYPRHVFWIEESNDGESWAKLNNSKYALFSED